jgi:hypothetical protein
LGVGEVSGVGKNKRIRERIPETVEHDGGAVCRKSPSAKPSDGPSLDMAETVIDDRERGERVIQGDHGGAVFGGEIEHFIEREGGHKAAMLSGAAAAGVFDQDLAHEIGIHTEEVRTIRIVGMVRADQSKVDFVDERGRLQRVVRFLAAQIACGDLAQLSVDQRHKLVQCGTIPLARALDEARHIAGHVLSLA